MPTVSESIAIDRPVDEVFAFVADQDNTLRYSTNLVEFEGEEPAVGSKNSGAVRVAGRKFRWTAECTEYEPGEVIAWRSIESPMSWTMHWHFKPSGDGTEVTVDQEIGSLGSFFGRLGDPVVTRMYARDVRNNLEALKELLEA